LVKKLPGYDFPGQNKKNKRDVVLEIWLMCFDDRGFSGANLLSSH